MFRTYDAHETGIFSFAGEGARTWRAVYLELRIPYFLVCYSTLDGQDRFTDTCLLSEQADVLSFCLATHSEQHKKVSQILAFIPNDRAGWSAEEVTQVWGSDDGHGASSPIMFVTRKGKRFGMYSPRNEPSHLAWATD